MSTLEILQGARELLSDRKKWYQGWYAASNPDNLPCVQSTCSPLSEEATCWCSLGACLKVSGDLHGLWHCRNGWCDILQEAFAEKFSEVVHIANDKRTHKEILAAFDRAIEIAKERKQQVTA